MPDDYAPNPVFLAGDDSWESLDVEGPRRSGRTSFLATMAVLMARSGHTVLYPAMKTHRGYFMDCLNMVGNKMSYPGCPVDYYHRTERVEYGPQGGRWGRVWLMPESVDNFCGLSGKLVLLFDDTGNPDLDFRDELRGRLPTARVVRAYENPCIKGLVTTTHRKPTRTDYDFKVEVKRVGGMSDEEFSDALRRNSGVIEDMIRKVQREIIDGSFIVGNYGGSLSPADKSARLALMYGGETVLPRECTGADRFVVRGTTPATRRKCWIGDKGGWVGSRDAAQLFETKAEARTAIDRFFGDKAFDLDFTDDYGWRIVKVLPAPLPRVEAEMHRERRRLAYDSGMVAFYSYALHRGGNKGLYVPEAEGFRSKVEVEAAVMAEALTHLLNRTGIPASDRDFYEVARVRDRMGQHAGIRVGEYVLVEK